VVKDRLGNELKIGDLVSMVVQDQRRAGLHAEVFGTVADIQQGGIVTPGGQRRPGGPQSETSGVVRVTFQMDVMFDPSQKVALELLKTHDPKEKKLLN
jgi:hypothetical protein